MMKNKIRSHDIEMLSAYLDDQLEARQRARLEIRLKTDKELSAALEDLRRTRMLLRSVKPVKAPRSFKLTPQMAGQKQARPIYPVFQLATAFATLLLVIVLAGDFLSTGTLNFSTAYRSRTPGSEAAQPLVQSTALVAGAAPTALPPAELPAQKALTLQATETPGIAALTAPQAESATQAAPPPGAQSQTDMSTAEALNSSGVLSNTVPVSPEVSALQAPETNAAGTSAAATIKSPQVERLRAEPEAGIPPLRIAEIGLAILAVALGAAAFFLRRGSI